VTNFIKYRKFLVSKNKLKIRLKNKKRFREDFITSNFSVRAKLLFKPLERYMINDERSMQCRDAGIFYSTRRATNGKKRERERERERENPDSRDF